MTAAMTLIDAVTFHLLTLQAEGRSTATTRIYMNYEKKFLEFLDARNIEPTLGALTPFNVRAALEWFRGRASIGTRGGQASDKMFVDVLKIWGNFLEREEIYSDSPLRKVRRVRVPKVLRQPFTQAELVALWGACRMSVLPARDEALLLLLLDTGVRIGEAMTLTLDKLQLDQWQLVVGLEGKGRRERIVPIGDPSKRGGGRAIRAIRQYLDKRPESVRSANRLFLARDGFPLSAAAGTDIIKRLGQAAGVENCHPHRCRHTFATWYLTIHSGDEMGLRRIIGHASREVTADYVHMSQSTIAQRAGQASLAETLGTRAAASEPQRAAVRRSEPILAAWSGGAPRFKLEPKPRPRLPQADEVIDLVKSDPALRAQLLRALLAETTNDDDDDDDAPSPRRRKWGT